MAKAAEPMHHLQQRKRVFLNLEQYPHPEQAKRWMDKLIVAASLFGPIMTIPQLAKIYIEKNAAGVSVVSWAAYLLVAMCGSIMAFCIGRE